MNNTATLKTVYDPSISGFALPRTAAFTNFTLSGSDTSNSGEFNVSGSFTNGWNFFTDGWKTGGTIFFEAFGFRDTASERPSGTGAVAYVPTNGYYWFSGAFSTSYARTFGFGSSDYVFPQHYNYRSFGFVVRPALE